MLKSYPPYPALVLKLDATVVGVLPRLGVGMLEEGTSNLISLFILWVSLMELVERWNWLRNRKASECFRFGN